MPCCAFFLPDLTGNIALCTIGTQRFLISIGPQCSGMEGLGLVLVFTSVWLWYFRKESRFPQALLLVPCALTCVWLLNIVRISALVLIGNAGAPEIAIVGFHSQAGWIAFTLVALSFSMASQKIAWVRRPLPPAQPGRCLRAPGRSGRALLYRHNWRSQPGNRRQPGHTSSRFSQFWARPFSLRLLPAISSGSTPCVLLRQ